MEEPIYKQELGIADFKHMASAHAKPRWTKESHLHEFKPIPDPNGNRAERRAAKKAKRKNK